ncbi:hypothetical protein CWC29_009940 [Pseudoalteromonas sp. S4498]|uniref:hypothetical protein n=1 Tax=Pseudoalteromonas galatheae TaxID=579562 RepID=UPI001108BEEC|nr:hypothetical protein [Pseudoalteromonas galatheae]NKC19158.1 hypothetical protein [Pseudoalteromonas galatheae]
MTNLETRILDSAAQDNFVEEILELTERGLDTESVVEALTQLHQSSQLDVFKIFSSVNVTDEYDKYSIRGLFSRLLPEIEVEVIEVINHLNGLSVNNVASHDLFESYIEFCAKDEIRVIKSLEYSIENSDSISQFISYSLLAGSKIHFQKYFSEALLLSASGILCVRAEAIHALGRFNYSNRLDDTYTAFMHISNIVSSEPTAELYVPAVNSLTWLKRANGSLSIDDSVEKIIALTDDRVLLEISKIVMFNEGVVSEETFKKLLCCLSSVNPQNKAIIRNFSYGLRKQIQNGAIDNSLAFIESYLIANLRHVTLNDFSSVVHEIIKPENEKFNFIVTKWLMSKKVALHSAVQDLFDHIHGEESSLHADEMLLISDTGIKMYTARKAVGWLFHIPVTATSFLVSLLETATDEEAEQLEGLIYEPLLINYPGKVKRYLESLKDDERTHITTSVHRVLDRLAVYDEGLESAWGTKELCCPQSHYETWYKNFDQQSERSYKESDKGGLSELFKSVTLLYGNGSIHQIYHGDGEQKRAELQPQSIEYRYEFPRQESLDPYGLELQLSQFKYEGSEQ